MKIRIYYFVRKKKFFKPLLLVENKNLLLRQKKKFFQSLLLVENENLIFRHKKKHNNPLLPFCFFLLFLSVLCFGVNNVFRQNKDIRFLGEIQSAVSDVPSSFPFSPHICFQNWFIKRVFSEPIETNMPTSASYNFPLHWSFTKVFTFFTSHVSSKLVDRSFHKSNFHNVGKQSLFCNQQKQTDQRSTIPFEKKSNLDQRSTIPFEKKSNLDQRSPIQLLLRSPIHVHFALRSPFLTSAYIMS